jgi:hypothetical protein
MRFPVLALFAALLTASATARADLPRVFLTSTQGSAKLSTWPDAHGLTGLAAADEICRTAAARGNLADAAQYVAWLSDGTHDAYCRIHGATGKRADRCGLGALPTGAGPWYRMDGLPALDRAEYGFPATPTASYMPRHVLYDETGAVAAGPDDEARFAFTSTRADGSLSHFSPTCGEWTNDTTNVWAEWIGAYDVSGDIAPSAGACAWPARLVCLERGAHGAPLPRRHASTARMAFVSSIKGSGYFATWPASNGTPGIAGGDQVCRRLAADASLPLSDTYKAFLTGAGGQGALARFVHDGPWYRTDGVLLAASKAALVAGPLAAPLQIDENRNPTPSFVHPVWTGSATNASATLQHCNEWTLTPDGQVIGRTGNNWTAEAFWSGSTTSAFCGSTDAAVYCLADNDSLFMDGME